MRAVTERLEMRRFGMLAAEHRAMRFCFDTDCIALKTVLDTSTHVLANRMFGCVRH